MVVVPMSVDSGRTLHCLLQGGESLLGLGEVSGLEGGPQCGQGLGARVCRIGVLARDSEVWRILLEGRKCAFGAAQVARLQRLGE